MIAEKICYPYLDNSSIVVEIGTGAGLLAARIINRFPKITYYSLEPNKDLNKYLKKHLPNNLREVTCSGFDLKGIDTSSIDFVIAYGVFTYLDTAAIVRYCKEAVRTLREGGYLLFDIFDTDRISPSLINIIETYSERFDSRPYMSGDFFSSWLKTKQLELISTFQLNKEDIDKYCSNFLLFRKIL